MYPFGEAEGDVRASSRASVTNELVSEVILAPHGIPFCGGVLNGLYVSRTSARMRVCGRRQCSTISIVLCVTVCMCVLVCAVAANVETQRT